MVGNLPAPERVPQVAGVEPHVRLAGLDHPAGDRLGDHVAGCEVGKRVLALHEAVAVEVDEEGALAAHCLGDQRLLALGVGAEPHDRGVELDELEVADPGPGPHRDGHPVPGGHAGVGRLAEDLAEATRGEDDRPAVNGTHPVALALAEDVQRQAGHAAVGGKEQVDGQRVLDDLDLRRPIDRSDQRALDLRARGVAAGVGDAVAVVTALAGQRQLAVGVVVELRAEGDQLTNRLGAFGHQDAYGLHVARTGPRDEGVALVLLGGVARPERCGDPALGPLRRPGGEDVLGDDEQAQRRVRGVDAQRGGEPCDAGAHHDDVGAGGPAGRRGTETARDRPVVWSSAQAIEQRGRRGTRSRRRRCRRGRSRCP